MFRSPRLGLFAASIAMCALTACSSTPTAPSPAANADADAPALFSTIALSPAAYDEFATVMQANAQASRAEPGNVSFEVFRPEDGTPTLLLFERWADQAAIAQHDSQPHLTAVQNAVRTAGAQASTLHTLVEVQPSGAATRRAPLDAATSRNVLVVLKVKPEAEATFVQAWRDVFPHARSAPGNAVFEIYRDTLTPQTYVLIERWDSAAAHEAHLAQPYSAALDAVLPDTLAAPIVDGESRFLAHGVLD
ncbi:antibiotic biosynthesis monooxygenase [Corticibacter populi]|uniref:Antibiotic biosynthesis monooxygenase n=1 Tax=Corticibacter populi TaxID=1550736 RepID=A0A3M6QWH9_9BURK|nr:antibiotic biosynthesis monooxygenase [Corticibacter populi]RMX06872.1 antibiotic biosynthesis monooxygenase [Corticibacter populi]RZS31534.1 quinol monooxygenase YgiN [Corticibacter populi]